MKTALNYIKNYPSRVLNNNMTLADLLFTISLIVGGCIMMIHAMGGVHYAI
jgi:hypothetical protein